MKRLVTILILTLAVSSMTHAYTYTYGPGTNFGGLGLDNTESLLVNGGGGAVLDLFNHSSARIESTTHLQFDPTTGWYVGGGIVEVKLFDYSQATITGGEILSVYVNSESHLALSGGRIDNLFGYLSLPVPVLPEDKYIQFICKSYAYNTGTKRLTGVWADDSLFNIQLVGTSPYPSTYDSINFTIVPEPLTLALLGIGAGLLRIRRSRIWEK
jgi:hypothetical protein